MRDATPYELSLLDDLVGAFARTVSDVVPKSYPKKGELVGNAVVGFLDAMRDGGLTAPIDVVREWVAFEAKAAPESERSDG